MLNYRFLQLITFSTNSMKWNIALSFWDRIQKHREIKVLIISLMAHEMQRNERSTAEI